MAAKSSAGWLVLLAALAIPGFMFFQWWTHLNSQSKADLEKRVRNRLPAGQIFSAAPAGDDKPVNPLAQQAAPAASTGTPVAVTGSSGVVTAAPAAGAAEAGAPGLTPLANAATTTPPVSGPEATGGAAPPAALTMLQTGTIAQVVLARDPFLSPFDLVRLAEAEAAQRRAQAELEDAANKKTRTQRAIEARPAESLVELQGIVSTAEGDKAIVNGEMVGQGDMIGQVKVVRITPTGVVFLYRGKRFIKGISK